jgi:hypothetical protein
VVTYQPVADARRIAVAGCKQVLEDGPDFCSSENEAEYSDHGEELTGMYTSELVGAEGKPNLARARLTKEQANALRAKGRAGGLDKLGSMPNSVQPGRQARLRSPTTYYY